LKKYALILAGGKGSRMGKKTPKQFLQLHGKAILIHTLERFIQAIPDLNFVLVLPKDQTDRWAKISHGTAFQDTPIAFGGNERTDSVRSGLDLVPDGALVGIHDAVRPLVSIKSILSCYQTAEELGNAIPVTPLTDSIRLVEGKDSSALDRANFVAVQTPQCFHSEAIKKAYQDLEGKFTDDASVMESSGAQINLVAGNVENIKITTPVDLVLAEQLLAK